MSNQEKLPNNSHIPYCLELLITYYQVQSMLRSNIVVMGWMDMNRYISEIGIVPVEQQMAELNLTDADIGHSDPHVD